MIRKNATEVGRKDVLMFLLDHPRRCFVYLFPNLVAFLLLDIGNPAVEAIPIGTRVLCGLLQSLSVRAAGFFVVSLAAVTPALRVQYMVMIALKDKNQNYNRDDVGEEDERANVTLERFEQEERGCNPRIQWGLTCLEDHQLVSMPKPSFSILAVTSSALTWTLVILRLD
ncbi:hypothetical protein BY996DRAFT_6411153 [Phakopsora pachyrhizi]|nr:hypothetical protein BY996DRAFT_6414556 [Phakopsora pachyrhizi]KAI8458126.1 hypothetical protein BY996DRAFT_6411153 [Phakopsora pachyrhizi]